MAGMEKDWAAYFSPGLGVSLKENSVRRMKVKQMRVVMTV